MSTTEDVSEKVDTVEEQEKPLLEQPVEKKKNKKNKKKTEVNSGQGMREKV